MPELRTYLFGKFRVERNGIKIEAITPGKVQELFCYLLVFRDHPQPRETLSETIWENQPPEKSRKYLRHTLWKLLCALHQGQQIHGESIMRIDPGWVQIDLGGNLWLDVSEFEQIHERYGAKKARELSSDEYLTIRNAVGLYTGDLLEGWYQDWCIFERERFRRMYLTLLDKLAKYCEAHQDYRAGLAYGAEILRQDRAFERAHRQMMRLYYLSGDRTQALRQYEQCRIYLKKELGVSPSRSTIQLYERICRDRRSPSPDRTSLSVETKPVSGMLRDTLGRLELLSDELDSLHLQVNREIMSIKEMIGSG